MDDLESFLRDLRALRERQGLSVDDLAERTHFPAQTIAAAESGPVRPTLPVVEAYVLACDAAPEPWEDRWRELRPGPAPSDVAGPGPERSGTGGWRRIPLPWLGAAVAVVALIGGGSAALTLASTGHETPRAAPPGQVTVPSGASVPAATAGSTPPAVPASHPASTAPSASAVATVPPSPVAASSGPAIPRPSQTPAPPAQPNSTEVTGPGCPQGSGDGVQLDNAASGPGWTTAQGGWAGDGCDGSSLWTMDPSGKQTASSALTWFFTPASADTHCRLAVFVPAQNAAGIAFYSISMGSTSLGTVPMDQAADTGQWITLGTYQLTGSPVQIQISPDVATLTSSGGGKGKGHDASIAASAASAVCG